jgi:hypothetical protein
MVTNLLSTVYQYYDSNNVFNAFLNDEVKPPDDGFIIIRLLENRQLALPLNKFDADTQINTITGFNDKSWQIDLYGKKADESSNILLTYLNSTSASNFLLQYNAGIGVVKDVKNLTKYNDRDRYMPRFVINFDTLDINRVLLPENGIGLNDIIINYKEIY